MKSLYNYIIHTENRYNNVSELGLILNTEITERDAIFVNRVGSVISSPIVGNNLVPEGSDVIVHHNVFRRWVGMDGKEKNSGSYYRDNMFFVAPDQVFAYKTNKDWIACEGYAFVEPINETDRWLLGKDKLLTGTLTYLDNNLRSQGLKKGHKVGFTPNSEYEFTIEGKKLWRILSNHINIDYELQERKGEYHSLSSTSTQAT